jgi:hypothetical protein
MHPFVYTREMRSFALAIYTLLILAFSPGATGSMMLGPETEVTDRELDAGDGKAGHKALASFDRRFFVVWTTSRSVMLGVFNEFGTRLDERVLVDGVEALEALIINDGSRLLVVWSDQDSIRISPLDHEGDLVIPGGLQIAGHGFDIDIAASSSRVVVIWQADSSLQGVVLDHSLDEVAPLGDVVERTSSPRVASDGESFVLTYADSAAPHGLYARTVGLDGELGPRAVVAADVPRPLPTILWSGTHFVVSYASPEGIHIATLDTENDLSGTPVLAWAADNALRSRLEPHPSGFLVVAETVDPQSGIPEMPWPSQLYSFIVSPDGERLSEVTPVSTIDTISTDPAIARGDDNYFATWNYSAGGSDFAVRGTVIHVDGEVLFADEKIPGLTISRAVRSQESVRVVHGDGVFIALWVERLRDRNELSLRYAPLDSDGRALQGHGIELLRSDFDPLPSIACGDVQCLVAYQVPTASRNIYSLVGRWISTNGRSHSGPFVITPQYLFPYEGLLTSNGETFATVAQSTLHLIHDDGTVATTPIPGDTTRHRILDALTSNGDEFLLLSSYEGQTGIVRAVRFDRDGHIAGESTVLDSAQSELAVTANGTDYLLVTEAVGGLRISATGTPIGGEFAISLTGGWRPSAAWNAQEYVVAWSDDHETTASLFLAEIAANGVVIGRKPAGRGSSVALAGGRSGDSMLLYLVDLNAGTGISVFRLQSRTIDALPTPVPRRRGVRRP